MQESTKQIYDMDISQNKSPEESKKVIPKQTSNTTINVNTTINDVKQDQNKSPPKSSHKQFTSQSSKFIPQKQNAQISQKLHESQAEQKHKKVTFQSQKSTKNLLNIAQSQTNKQNVHLAQTRTGASISLYSKKLSQSQCMQNTIKNPMQNYSSVNGKKVYMSEQDVLMLKKLKLDNRRREQRIRDCIVQREILAEKMKTQQMLSEEKCVNEQRQRRKHTIQERQKILSVSRATKLQQNKQQNLQLHRLNSLPKLYQLLQQQDLHTQQQQKSTLTLHLQSLSKSRTVNFDHIRQHQKQYVQNNRQHIEQSRERIKSQLKEIEGQFNSMELYRSGVYQKVRNEKRELLEGVREGERRRKMAGEKIKEYERIVRSNHMPRTKSIQKVNPAKPHIPNLTQTHSIGNSYMKQGNLSIDRNKSITIKTQETHQLSSQKRVYKDYLLELRTSGQGKQNIRSTNIQKQLQAIKLIKNPSQKYQRVQGLQVLIENQSRLPQVRNRLTLGDKGKDERVEVRQIKAKIRLMEGLEMGGKV